MRPRLGRILGITNAAATGHAHDEIVDQVWLGAKRSTAALVTGLFPFLFLFDQLLEMPVSPVLPGLVLFALAIVVLPLPVAEVRLRRILGLDEERARGRMARRGARRAKVALNLAVVWFAAWILVGA